MPSRSSSAAVRNPIAANPVVAAIFTNPVAEHPAAAAALCAALKATAKEWRAEADAAYAAHKAPMWRYRLDNADTARTAVVLLKSASVNARHLALAIPDLVG